MLIAAASGCSIRFHVIVSSTTPTAGSPTAASVDLEQGIEMIDYGLSTDSGSPTFIRSSLTNFDTTWFDGTVTYTFEIVAKNTDGVNRNVELRARNIATINNNCAGSTAAGSAVAGGAITVPTGTASLTRISSTFTPVAGNMSYFLFLPATTGIGDMQIASARIIIKQVGATKTHIYVPLTSSTDGVYTHLQPSAYDDLTTSAVFTQGTPINYGRWKKEVSKFATIATTNGFVLDTVITTLNPAQTVSSELFDVTTGLPVASTLSSFTGTAAIQLCNKIFESTDANFIDDDEFELKLKVTGGVTGELYKGGLWISLTNLSKFMTYHRLGKAAPAFNSNTISVYDRRVINTSSFLTPTFYYECLGSASATGMAFWIGDYGVNDSGVIGLSAVTNSNVSFAVGAKNRLRTSASLNLTDGDRYSSVAVQSGAGSVDLTGCYLIIQSN